MDHAATALQRYERSMRRSRRIYAVVVAAVVVVLASVFAVVVARGEAAHATLRTVAKQPAALNPVSPAATQTVAWRTTDRTAAGLQPWNGTVVTYSAHTVGGRDARTGVRTWSYTRTDRTVCSVGQVRGTTIAVYLHSGSCDEVSAFDSGTGRRAWTRTLDQDGAPVDGRPSIAYGPSTMLVSTSAVVYAIDPAGGINQWVYDRTGCVINRAVLGTSGVLISQTCGAGLSCAGVSFCGKGPQLLLRNLSAGRLDPSKKNFDQITWNQLGDAAIPVSADVAVTAVPRGGDTLQFHDPATGRRTTSVVLDPAPDDPASAVAVASQGAQLLWVQGRLMRLNADGSRVWSSPTDGPPTVVDTVGTDNPYLDSARLTALVGGRIASLDPGTGVPDARVAVASLPSRAAARPLGAGFLVSGPDGTVATR